MFRFNNVHLRFSISLAAAVAGAACLAADTTSTQIDFARDIQPILSDNCYACHGPDEAARQADLRLDTESGLLSDSSVIVPGEPSDSELIRRLTTDDPDEHMPPLDSTLHVTAGQIASIKQWIQAGAKWTGHWAYQPIQRPTPPRIDKNDALNPIDSFVAERLRSDGLKSADRAELSRLLRRVTLDLTGLPPTPAEVERFVHDQSPDAYEKVIDRLLASTAYGERMAWPWLDAARYADSNGFQGDRERTMWPWRDWAIHAINENMPYDDFTIWQIAGDQIPNASEQQKLATGFCRNHMINGEGGRIPAENRVEYIFDQMETVSTIWLGMTMQCCRCHDHKFDPVTQDEYFKLFAFFNQTPVDGAGGDPQTPPAMSVANESQRRELDQIDRTIADAARQISDLETVHPAIREVLQTENEEDTKTAFAAFDTAPTDRSIEQLKQLEELAAEKEPTYSALLKTQRELLERRQAIQKSLPRVMIMADIPREKHRTTRVLDRGLYNKPLHEVASGTPAALPPLVPDNDELSPHRLDLARWLVDPKHPLTARVTVNRIWSTFFGAGLVETIEDFGVQSKRPAYPNILDWLASELIRSGWDTKHIVRLIVTSSTYQQSSKNSESLQVDPANRLLARGPRFRMPSWMLRDQALSVSGLLANQIGGPPVKPYQPPGIWEDATFGNKSYSPDQGANLYRRSIYVFWRRIVGPTMFFDSGKRQTCEVKIARTNTPLHALATLNDVTYVEAARAMAERLFAEAENDDAARVDYAFRLATARPPSRSESTRLLNRLRELTDYYEQHVDAAVELLEVGDTTRDQSIPSAQHAAYTCVCLLILNLDETLTN